MGPCINKAENYHSLTSFDYLVVENWFLVHLLQAQVIEQLKDCLKLTPWHLKSTSLSIRDKCHWNKIQGNLRGGEIQTQDDSETLYNRATAQRPSFCHVSKRNNGYESVYGWNPSTYSGVAYVLK